MYYRPKNELLIKTARNENRQATATYIHADQKKAMWGKLNYLIGAEKRKNKFTLEWRDEYSHFVDGVFGNCPMILNYLSLRGFQNVLFVGYYNAAQVYWTIPRKGNSLFPTPSISSDSLTMPSPNVWIQCLPIVKMAYGYTNFNMHTLVPPEWRYRHVMHALYNRYEVDLIPCNKQYMYGKTDMQIDSPSDVKYDAVVFGACTNIEDLSSFHIAEVAAQFNSVMKNDSVFIELKSRKTNENVFLGGAVEDNNQWLPSLFANHSIWDNGYLNLSDEDKTILYNEMDEIITSYKNPLRV